MNPEEYRPFETTAEIEVDDMMETIRNMPSLKGIEDHQFSIIGSLMQDAYMRGVNGAYDTSDFLGQHMSVFEAWSAGALINKEITGE